MWKRNNSLALSKLCVYLFMAALVGVLVAGPWLVDWLMLISHNARVAPKNLFLLTMYAGGALAALLLYDLYRLLHSIGEEQVFVAVNVARLRRISWYCMGGGAVAALSGLYYLPWLFLGVAAAFVGLIVRVVKNVIAQAIAIKEENDLMI